MTSLHDPMLRRKDAVSFEPGGSQSTRDLMMLPRIRARWVAHEIRGRCGDKHELFSETPDLALVKAVIAHAARRAESEDGVVVVFDVQRATSTLKRKETLLFNFQTLCPPNAAQRTLGSRAKALCGTRPAAASWRDEWRKGLVSCGLSVGIVSRCCFHNESCSVAGTVHGDDIFVAGPRQDVAKMGTTLKKRWASSCNCESISLPPKAA